jgi:magnesium transporter
MFGSPPVESRSDREDPSARSAGRSYWSTEHQVGDQAQRRGGESLGANRPATFDGERLPGRTPTQAPGVLTVCQVSQEGGSREIHFGRREVSDLLAGGFFWLDLDRPEPEDFEILREAFGFHPLAIEDSEHFDQRAKIDDYDDFVFLVVYGASADGDKLVEVHCFYSARFLVTVHRDDCPAFVEIRHRYQQRHEEIDRPSLLLYRIVDGLVGSFFPILADFDNRIDELEDQIFRAASDRQLQEIFAMKRLLVGMRKAVTPQRDAFATLRGGLAQLPGLAAEDEHYFRDVYDHLIRISDLIDSYRDLLTGAMDVYLSTVSNRLNSVMKQLAVIATIFLPLSWLTGFFGQNFGWLTGRIGHWQAFVGAGVGTELVALAILLALFKRRGWF